MHISIDENTVELAYRLLLGRNPESPEAIKSHLSLGSLDRIRTVMMASTEFRSKLLQSSFRQSKWVSTDVMDRFVMWVDLHDRYVSHGCLNNNWEPEESSFFASRLKQGDVVLDIGANVGWFSLLAAKHIGKHGRVHAFEPRPETVRMLKRTIADNGLRDTVKVWEYALTDQAAMLRLAWGTNTENPGGSHLVHGSVAASPTVPTLGNQESTNVIGCELDVLLPDISPDIIKIDVEGAEPLALRGAKAALARGKPVILSELFPSQLKKVSGFTPRQFIAQMADVGYGCYLLEKGLPTRKLDDYPDGLSRELVSVIFEWRGLR